MTADMDLWIVYLHFVINIENQVAELVCKIVSVLVRAAYRKRLLGKPFGCGKMNEIILEKFNQIGLGNTAFFVVFKIRIIQKRQLK